MNEAMHACSFSTGTTTERYGSGNQASIRRAVISLTSFAATSRHARRIARRVQLHDIGPHEPAGKPLDDAEHLTHRQATGLVMRDAGRECRIEHVEVERQIHGTIQPQGLHGRLAEITGRQLANPEPTDLRSLRVVEGADSHLHERARVAAFEDAGEWRCVRVGLPLEILVQVRVRVEMKNREAPMPLRVRADERKRHRVVAAQGEERRTVGHRGVGGTRNLGGRGGRVAARHAHVTAVYQVNAGDQVGPGFGGQVG